MTPRDLDRPLRRAFRFEAADLDANRAGRLSPRQAALLRAGRIGMWLSLVVFAAVMLGSVGLAALLDRRLQGPRGRVGGLGAAAAVAVAAIAVGYAVSRRHLSTARARRLRKATGAVEILSDAPEDCRVRIGGTPLRLPDVAALEVFRSGVEYRVYYLAGPVALVLSAEALAGGFGPSDGSAEAGAGRDEPATATAQITVVRRGYVIVALLGVLALGIPVAGVLVGDLPPRVRPLAWVGLLAIALGFAWFALARLGGPRRRRP
jgi:hypothetical protein